jgi:hypothetical protein
MRSDLSAGDAEFRHNLQEIRRTEEKWKLWKSEDFDIGDG